MHSHTTTSGVKTHTRIRQRVKKNPDETAENIPDTEEKCKKEYPPDQLCKPLLSPPNDEVKKAGGKTTPELFCTGERNSIRVSRCCRKRDFTLYSLKTPLAILLVP